MNNIRPEFLKPTVSQNQAFVQDRLGGFSLARPSSNLLLAIDLQEQELARRQREFFGIREDPSAKVVESGYKILEMLGLRENVSPQIEYILRQESLVDVWILSLESLTIKHLLSAKQPEGTHSITWNGTNDNNVRMPCGYYIGQVFANKQRILQRGIRW